MGMGGGGSSTSKTKPEIPSWLGNEAQGIVNLWRGNIYDLMQMNPTEQAGWQGMLNTIPGMEQAGQGALQGTQEIMARADPNSQAFKDYYASQAKGLTDAYSMGTAPSEMSQAMGAGAFGGSADAYKRMQNQYGLGQNLAGLSEQLTQQQQGLGLQAAGMIPGLEQNLAAPGRLESQLGQEQHGYATNALSNYANLIQSFMGPYSGTTQVTKQGK